MRRVVHVLGLGLLALVPRVARGHGALADRAASADHAVESRPGDRDALVARAEIALEAGAPANAIVDLERAVALSGDCAAPADLDRARCRDLALMLAEAHLAAGDGWSADEVLGRVLVASAADPRALYLRARVAAADDRYADAARDLEASLAVTSDPSPSAYLELARLYVSDGDDDAATSTLERAASRVGALAVLVDAAVEIETRRGRFAEALAWTDRWEERMRASPAGRALRSEILLRMGRADDARKEAEIGLHAIDALPNARRSSGAMVDVRARLQATMDGARAASEPTDAPPTDRPWWLGVALLLLLAVPLGRTQRRLEAR